MLETQKFLTASLSSHPKGHAAARMLASALNAVEPGTAVKRYLEDNPLPPFSRVFSFGLGKAACAMTSAASDCTSLTDSLIITKHAVALTLQPATVIEGDHPIPGRGSLAAGDAAVKFISQLTKDDLLLCLISGGGSALMTAPRIPLADLQSLTSSLLACGARIDEINTLRRHLDHLKGGGLAKLAGSRGAAVVSLLLSDVVNDSMEAIASGPTVPDQTTCTDARTIIEKYHLTDRIPESIIPALTETAKPEDPIFERVHNSIIASNEIALQAAQKQAEQEGFFATVMRRGVQGEASGIGLEMAKLLKESAKKMQRPFCLLAGGETTVTIKGIGKGGRNQELALAAVEELAGVENVMLITLATDGEDGPTNAAGAVVTGKTAQRAEQLGLSAKDYLSRNDAHTYFDRIGDLIRIGPSGTNVNDLIICLAF